MDRQLVELAQKRGYEILNVQDGMCDLRNTDTGMIWQEAPLEDVRTYLQDPLGEPPEDALYDGLALDRYGVIGHFWFNGHCALMMQARKADPCPYCVEYCGSGRYFRDFDSMMVYAGLRFGGGLNRRDAETLDRLYRKHRQAGTPIRWKDIFTGEG